MPISYRDAGVDIDAGEALVKRIGADRDGLIQEIYEREGKRP